MADPNDTLDPEPVDAEFEPAEDMPVSGPPGPNVGIGLLLGLAIFSMLGGGLIGAVGGRFIQPIEDAETGVSNEIAALTDVITNLETRLAALEAEDPAAMARDGLSDDFAGIETRIAALEAVPPGTTDLTPLETRLDALENAPAAEIDPALAGRVEALEDTVARNAALTDQALDAAQSGSAPAIDPQILDDFSQRLTALESAPAATPVTGPDHSAEIAALNTRIEQLETALGEARRVADEASQTASSAAETAGRPDTGGQAARQLAARALALTALRDMAAGGGSFEAERAALARLWRGNEAIAALASHSRSGAPTINELAASYPGEAIRDAGAEPTRLWGMIDIRRVDPDADETDALALTALAEDRLADDDLEAAVTITERLEGAALDAARDWLVQARARRAVDINIEALRAQLTRNAAEQGADPS